uniref:Monofunctional riboflavin biosynthesis protein RIBA 3, chloroplastic n=1 Tax=Populus alba TaxID=43335 RepID=A0A4U5Q3Z5_POPAL|nr:monofunctional riboflavin biosynthesis protein RIBA 3, chloroplastic [Populus alba]
MEADAQSWGVIVNSFEELEKTHVPSLESFYMDGAKAWCLGPLFLHDKSEGLEKSTAQKDSSTLTQWLNEQVKPDSVIYVSFGTQADVSDAQLDEVAFGLEESGSPFIWVARSKTWSLPGGMEEKIKGRGLIVKEWLSETFRDFSWHKNKSRPVQMSPTCWATGVGSASDESFLKGSENGSLLGAFDESASAPFVTLEAEITPETIDFFVNDADGDPDCPTEGYSSIEQALHTLREGKLVIVVDDENGDIEGNLIMAASVASPQQVSFLIKNGSGIVSVGMKEEDLERLKLPLMSPKTENEDSSAPTFTITVDAKSGTCTGVSASDRAKIVLALSSLETKPEDFRRPGHVFPLEYRNGGVLRRAGHTEASVDLVMMAGLPPVFVLSAIIDPEDGQKGRSARARAEAIGRVARRAVQDGGSSHDALSKLIDQLRAY